MYITRCFYISFDSHVITVYLALLYHAAPQTDVYPKEVMRTPACIDLFIEDQAFSPSYDLAPLASQKTVSLS